MMILPYELYSNDNIDTKRMVVSDRWYYYQGILGHCYMLFEMW